MIVRFLTTILFICNTLNGLSQKVEKHSVGVSNGVFIFPLTVLHGTERYTTAKYGLAFEYTFENKIGIEVSLISRRNEKIWRNSGFNFCEGKDLTPLDYENFKQCQGSIYDETYSLASLKYTHNILKWKMINLRLETGVTKITLIEKEVSSIIPSPWIPGASEVKLGSNKSSFYSGLANLELSFKVHKWISFILEPSVFYDSRHKTIQPFYGTSIKLGI